MDRGKDLEYVPIERLENYEYEHGGCRRFMNKAFVRGPSRQEPRLILLAHSHRQNANCFQREIRHGVVEGSPGGGTKWVQPSGMAACPVKKVLVLVRIKENPGLK